MSTEGEEDGAAARTGPPPHVPAGAGAVDGAGAGGGVRPDEDREGGAPSRSPGGGGSAIANGRPRAEGAEGAEDPDRTLPLDVGPPGGEAASASAVLSSLRSPDPAERRRRRRSSRTSRGCTAGLRCGTTPGPPSSRRPWRGASRASATEAAAAAAGGPPRCAGGCLPRAYCRSPPVPRP